MRVFAKIPLTILCLLCIGPIIALAAEDCPAIVQAALVATDEACVGVGRNQACYGNVQLDAVPQAGVEAFNFSKPGDLVDVTAVQSLTLSSMDEAAAQWGVALMKIQANLPDTLPGQNVTFLMFGDVELQNAAPSNIEPATVSVTANGTANVRSGPSKNDDVVGSLSGGQTLTADGRNSDSTWLRIQLEDGTPGWVFADLVTVDGDVDALTLVDPLALVPPADAGAPTQAFYFKSGVGDVPCAEAPNGLMIQSPAGAERVNLTINGVDLTIGSTAFLQTPNGDDASEMVISTLAGIIQVESDGVQQTVIPGAQVSVPLDANGQAAGAPSTPEPYDEPALTPVVHEIVQGHKLFVHIEDDKSDLLDQLIAECGLYPFAPDAVTVTLSANDVEVLTACVKDFMASQVTLPTAGLWQRASFTTEFSGQCLQGGFGSGDGGGGGVEMPSIPVYGIKLPGKPVYLIVENQAYPHVEDTTDRFGSSRAPYYSPQVDGKMQTIGTIETVYSDYYQVIAPDQIKVTISSQETGGCSSTGSYIMTLVSADDSVIDENAAADIIEQTELYATPQEVPPLEFGAYDFAYTMPADNCPASITPPDTDLMILTDNGDGSINLGAAGTQYQLYKSGSDSYGYDNGFGGDHYSISLNSNSDGTLNFMWMGNDTQGAFCTAMGTLTYSSQ